MKSIFFVALFVSLAIFVSQPEKAQVKYIAMSVSAPHSFIQNDLSKDFKMDIVPNSESNSYEVTLNKEVRRLIKISNIVFPFSSCELSQRPNISLSCELKGLGSELSKVISLSVKPMIIIGQEKIEFYIVQVSKLNSNGESIDYKFFTKPINIQSGRLEKNINISQN